MESKTTKFNIKISKDNFFVFISFNCVFFNSDFLFRKIFNCVFNIFGLKCNMPVCPYLFVLHNFKKCSCKYMAIIFIATFQVKN